MSEWEEGEKEYYKDRWEEITSQINWQNSLLKKSLKDVREEGIPEELRHLRGIVIWFGGYILGRSHGERKGEV